jgi:hypothetical protein
MNNGVGTVVDDAGRNRSIALAGDETSSEPADDVSF